MLTTGNKVTHGPDEVGAVTNGGGGEGVLSQSHLKFKGGVYQTVTLSGTTFS